MSGLNFAERGSGSKPCARAVNERVNDFGLLDGYSAETSGGILAALPSREAAEQFLAALRASGQQSPEWGWIIGDVVEAGVLEPRSASIAADRAIIEV